MRTVYLSPDHSPWWLLSPGITLFFDEICISQRDYKNLIDGASDSSYHEQLALHYQRFAQSGVTNIRVIEDSVLDYDPNLLATQLSSELLTSAESNPEFIDPIYLVRLARDSFLYWIQCNQRNLYYLRADEPYYAMLIDRLAEWKGRLNRFDTLLTNPNRDTLHAFVGDRQLLSTFNRLVASAARCIELTDRGYRLYDPNLDQYMPMIELLERFMSVPQSNSTHAFQSFDAYSFRMSRYGETVPVQLSTDGLFRTIDDYKKVRKALERVDDTFSSINSVDLVTAFQLAKEEIAPLVREAKAASTTTEYAFWGVGLKYDFLSWLALPYVTDRIKELAGAFSLIANRVGTVAGSYALVAEQMISHQQLVKSQHRLRTVDSNKYDAHFKDFIDRDPRDRNAV